MALLDQSQNSYYEGPDGVQLTTDKSYNDYQFVSLTDIINQFMLIYVGEDKIISKAKRLDVAFHAQRALAELSFDTFKSCKSQEITVPSTLQMILPQDYVNYTKISWVDSAGIKHPIYPTTRTSNPSSFQQNSDGTFKFETNNYVRENDNATGTILAGTEFEQYGITQSGLTSDKDGSGDFESDNLLPNFEKEIRIELTNASGHCNPLCWEVSYGPGSGMQMNFYNTHDIEVGMTIFAPGVPLNSTVATVGDSTSSNFPGMGITFTNPEYEQWLLDGSVGTNPGRPTDTQQADEQIIFVDLNKKSTTWSNYSSTIPSENQDDYEDDTYWPMSGGRYGLDPQHAQSNGSFYIDCNSGKIHFSSNISGKTVILDYISDSLGTEQEMQVHKFAEEAMYKWISHAILTGKANIPEQIIRRLKKERFAETRKAKLRLSNIKLEELTQILRGKSKWIKH